MVDEIEKEEKIRLTLSGNTNNLIDMLSAEEDHERIRLLDIKNEEEQQCNIPVVTRCWGFFDNAEEKSWRRMCADTTRILASAACTLAAISALLLLLYAVVRLLSGGEESLTPAAPPHSHPRMAG